MEGVTGMDALWTGVTSSVGKIVPLIGTVTTGLLSNELFQIMIGIVVFMIILGIVLTLTAKIRRKGK